MKTITTTIRGSNKNRMTGPELVKALRSARDGDDITARITFRGRIKSVMITRTAPVTEEVKQSEETLT